MLKFLKMHEIPIFAQVRFLPNPDIWNNHMARAWCVFLLDYEAFNALKRTMYFELQLAGESIAFRPQGTRIIEEDFICIWNFQTLKGS